jgi:hypothetical protein
VNSIEFIGYLGRRTDGQRSAMIALTPAASRTPGSWGTRSPAGSCSPDPQAVLVEMNLCG